MIDVSREGWVKTDALQCKDSSPEILPRFLPRSFFSKFNETRSRLQGGEERGRGQMKQGAVAALSEVFPRDTRRKAWSSNF